MRPLTIFVRSSRTLEAGRFPVDAVITMWFLADAGAALDMWARIQGL